MAKRAALRRQSTVFLWLYALAWAGGAVAYVPFLTILLPMDLAAMVGDQRVHWLAYITFCGNIAASIGGIGFGLLSDRSGVRVPWIVTGLIGTVILTLCVPLARQPIELLLIIIVWQLALNMMLGPLSAWAADLVPPSQLGALGGLLALSPALGSVAGALVTIPGVAGPDGRLALVALMVAVCVLPALLFGRPVLETTPTHEPLVQSGGRDRHAVIAMWIARFLVQICEATLFVYLYYYFRSIDASRDANSIARLFGLVLCSAVPVALLIGRWSDRHGKPIFPLAAAALTVALALMAMAAASTSFQAAASYVLFGLATTIFLSLHSAQTFRVLRRPNRRGRDLGLFNLTNTAPSMVMPWLTILVVPKFGFARLFILLALLALAASAICWKLARARTSITG